MPDPIVLTIPEELLIAAPTVAPSPWDHSTNQLPIERTTATLTDDHGEIFGSVEVTRELVNHSADPE